jgi:outer membrane protein TolC
MKKIFISTVCLLMAIVSNSQTNPELKALISQSFTYFPRIQELQKSAEASDMRVDLARSNYYPVINGTGSYSYVNPISQKDFGTGVLQFQPYNNYNFNVSITQPIWDFGKTNAQIAKAKT